LAVLRFDLSFGAYAVVVGVYAGGAGAL